MPRRFVLRAGAILAVSALVLAGAATSAAAHAKLESMTPADGSSMAAPPTKVVLTFNEPVGSSGTQVQVKSPSGKDVTSGDVQVVDNTVTQPVGAMVEAGRYQIDARVVSDDGHPITITGSFTVTHAGHPAEQPVGTASTPQNGGSSNVVTIVAMCLIMLVVVALAIVIVRRRPAAR